MSTSISAISESGGDSSKRQTMDYVPQDGLSPTFVSPTELSSPGSPYSNVVLSSNARHNIIPGGCIRTDRNLNSYHVVDPFPQFQEVERRNALAPSPQVSLTRLPEAQYVISSYQNSSAHPNGQANLAVTDFHYVIPAIHAAKIDKSLMKKLSSVSRRKRNSNARTSPSIRDNQREIRPSKAEFTSTTLHTIMPSTTRLEREYLFPRATSCISYSDERIRMRLANKANDDRSMKAIMYANYDDVGMRSASALAVLNPFKLAPESLLHPHDEITLQPLKKAVRKSSSIKKHLFRSYITAAAANLRAAVSEQGFYVGDTQICTEKNQVDQSESEKTTHKCPAIIYMDQDGSQDDAATLQRKHEEMLYRLKYSHFILKIINIDDDCANQVMEDMDDLLHCAPSTKSLEPQDSGIESQASGITIKRITNDGIKYTVKYDTNLSTPIVIKIIASHSILELLYATYKDKRDLIRIIRDYEEDQVAFRMGLLQQTANSSIATIMTPPSAPCKYPSPRSQKLSGTEMSIKSVPDSYSRAFFSLTNTYKSNNLEYEPILEPKTSEAIEAQASNINTCIQRLNYELKRLEEKRRQRTGYKETIEPQSYSLNDLGLSSFSSTLEFSPDRAGPSTNWHSPSVTTLISQRPIRTSIVEDRLTDVGTHTMALSLLDTFTARKDMCKTILLKQSQRAPDDLLARASQLRAKLAEKQDIEAFNAEQRQKTSMDVHKSNKEVISYMLSSHHDGRKIFAKEDLKPAIDKIGRQVVARDYFHGDAPNDAQTANLDTDEIRKTLNMYIHNEKKTKKQSATGQKTIAATEHTSRYNATRATLARPKDAHLPRSLNFKTNAITQPAGPWKSMKITKPDYYPK